MKRSKTKADSERPRKFTWGGRREGAGRKPKGDKAGVSHRSRKLLAARFPVHVIARIQSGLPSLRTEEAYVALLKAFASGCDRNGFRLVHYSVQQDHLHWVVEAVDRDCLSRGLQGLSIRVARAVNRVWGRAGKFFADRYEDHILRTPGEVRDTLACVLNNALRHGVPMEGRIDRYASGWWFDGWREKPSVAAFSEVECPVAQPRSKLLSVGWRKHGLIRRDEVPGPECA
ncbi:MAG: transposase [Planctomycetes bacterium]|nr:transposase [Planctomycetota bacterium]MCB9889689.1 transposase [Planctomycetota bacterium]